MKGLNRVQFIGHLGRSPEVTTFDSGLKKAEFVIATNDSYKDKEGQWVEITDWHNCFATGKLADVIDTHFVRGTKVLVEGKLKHRKYKHPEKGHMVYVTEVRVTDFMFLSKKKTDEGEMVEGDQNNGPIADDEDLPF